jgi:hypothetical protein
MLELSYFGNTILVWMWHITKKQTVGGSVNYLIPPIFIICGIFRLGRVVQYCYPVSMKLVGLIDMFLNWTCINYLQAKIWPSSFLYNMICKKEMPYRHWIFTFLYERRKNFHESHLELNLNGTHHLLVYANDVNLFGYKIGIIQKKEL